MAPILDDEFRGTERFLIEGRLGAGGMGIVYEALDREKGVRVALKTLRRPSPDALLRFKREFRSLQDLHHPNLITLGELVEEAGVWFFTMELLRGVDFLEYVRPRNASMHAEQDPQQSDASPTETTLRASPAQRLFNEIGQERPAFNEAHLRNGLVQLLRGLSALHATGRIHRDVKPSNILVTNDERVVILDFGLVMDSEDGHRWTDDSVVGTAAYMAPEQAASSGVGTEADCYSVGVLLYESLLSVLPFTGSNLKMLMDKQRAEPQEPRALDPSVPEDLSRLCMDLLRADPRRRLSAEAALERLGVGSPRTGSGLSRTSTQTSAFVGRLNELRYLQDALDDACAGRQVTVLLHGKSGIGKTAIIRRFIETTRANDRTVILAGRCYEREFVPYKAVDGIVDALAYFMARLPKHEAARLAPRRASLLLRVFPILRKVDGFAGDPLQDVPDPQELRTRLFGAFRELCARLTDRSTVVAVIDDIQWADPDSLALLSDVLRPPDTPPLLLLATCRDAPARGGEAAPAYMSLPSEVRHLAIEKLPLEDARQLARRLLRAAGHAATDQATESLAREADGHPLFIDELVRDLALGTGASVSQHLDEALWGRVVRLAPIERQLIELLATAGAPVPRRTLADAASISLAESDKHLRLLCASNLARTSTAVDSDAIEPFHDRVTASILSNLSIDQRRAHHRDLAKALRADRRAKPELVAMHLKGAGETSDAARYAVKAAADAMEALAFDHAAELYKEAIQLGAGALENTQALRIQLGDALANAGRGAESAEAYLSALPDGNAAEQLELQRRAAQQLLVAGKIDEGIAIMRAVLGRMGLSYPKTPTRALLSLVATRARLRMRGFGYTERDKSQLSAEELARLDACIYVAKTMVVADNIRGSVFAEKGLAFALKAGEPHRLAWLLAQVGSSRSATSTRARREAEKLFAPAERLAKKAQSPDAMAFVEGVRGIAHYLGGQFVRATAELIDAERMFREQCVGVHFEISIIRIWLCRAMQYRGQCVELAKLVDGFLADCRQRSDLYGATSVRLSAVPFLLLTRDKSDQVSAEVADALATWCPSGFHVQHWYALLAGVAGALYDGNAALAQERLRASQVAMRGSQLLRVQFVRVFTFDMIARAALAGVTMGGSEKRDLLSQVRHCAAKIEAEDMPPAGGLAALIRAGLEVAGECPERARTHLEAAVERLQAADMTLHASVAQRCLGRLVGGERGRTLVEAAEAWMKSQEIKNPERIAAMLAPGL